MSEFAFTPPPKLKSLSAAELATVDDGVLESAVIDYVVDHMLGPEEGLDAIANWPSALQTWYAAFVVDAEVLNGGFNQFFFNSSGTLAPAVPSALRELGVDQAADIVEEALALLGQHAPALEAAAEEGTIDAFMETYLDQPFSELDDRYGRLEEALRDARIRFLRDNAGALSQSSRNA